jgi:hypothetical protein
MKFVRLTVPPSGWVSVGARYLAAGRAQNSIVKIWSPILPLLAAVVHALTEPLTKKTPYIYVDALRRAWRLWRSRNSVFATLGVEVMAGICGLLADMSVEMFSDDGLIEPIWAFAALTGICECLYRAERTRPESIQRREAVA